MKYKGTARTFSRSRSWTPEEKSLIREFRRMRWEGTKDVDVAVELLRRLLAGRDLEPSEVYRLSDAIGLRRTTVQYAARIRIGVEAYRGEGRRWYWRLPPQEE